jgi:pentatricopeptide repeat protein
VRLYEEALKTKQELGDVREVAVTQYSLANVLVQQGKIEEGVRLYEESLKTYQEIGDIRSIAVTQNALANVLVQQGKIEEAMRLYELSLKTKQELGDVREVAVTKVTLGRLLWQQNMQSQALSDIWQAYVSLIQIGYLPDAEAVRNTLISIKVTDIAHFNTIWEGVMNIPQPEWLDQVQPSPSNNELPPITDEIIQAVNEFVNTQDWEATHQILLQQQPLLLSPEVERLFEHNIALALQKQNQRFADMLTIHLSLLRACKQMGVEAAWTQFQSSFT